MEHYRQIKVGDRVAVRDAFGAWHRGQIAPVPKDWRDASGSHATTTRGDFPKAWVQRPDHLEPVPFPVEDIDTIANAEQRIAARERELDQAAAEGRLREATADTPPVRDQIEASR
jgi:hypothetical protein